MRSPKKSPARSLRFIFPCCGWFSLVWGVGGIHKLWYYSWAKYTKMCLFLPRSRLQNSSEGRGMRMSCLKDFQRIIPACLFDDLWVSINKLGKIVESCPSVSWYKRIVIGYQLQPCHWHCCSPHWQCCSQLALLYLGNCFFPTYYLLGQSYAASWTWPLPKERNRKGWTAPSPPRFSICAVAFTGAGLQVAGNPLWSRHIQWELILDQLWGMTLNTLTLRLKDQDQRHSRLALQREGDQKKRGWPCQRCFLVAFPMTSWVKYNHLQEKQPISETPKFRLMKLYS